MSNGPIIIQADEITFTVEKTPVVAKTRKLKANYTTSPLQDMNVYYGHSYSGTKLKFKPILPSSMDDCIVRSKPVFNPIVPCQMPDYTKYSDAERELSDMMAKEIKDEIDREIVNRLSKKKQTKKPFAFLDP